MGLDSGILLNSEVWRASGHIGGFSDPLMDCKDCKTRFRADKLIEEDLAGKGAEYASADGMSEAEMVKYLTDNNIVCPNCGSKNFTDIRKFNLMFKTFMGVTDESSATVYLRPETAQGIFVNFKNVARTTRKKIPFGIGQIGKAFRNEITPGNFIFRTREFEQMELEFFCKPGTDMEWFDYWRHYVHQFLLQLGLKDENLRLRNHGKEELSFYSKATTDFEYRFPFGWGELWGVANRTDYDLSQHMEFSKQDLQYLDPVTNEKYTPYVIEPSVSPNRIFLSVCWMPMRKKPWRTEMSEMCSTFILLWHHLKQPSCPCPRSWGTRPTRSTAVWPSTSWWITTMPVPSASATGERMRSVPPSASPWTSRPWRTTPSQSETGTPWNRSACRPMNWSPT